MPRSTRTFLMLVGTAATLGLLVGNAAANHLSTSSRSMRSTWTSVEFIEPLGGAIRCSLTLEGSLHSATITKTPELLVGFITRASISNPCSGGEAAVLPEGLPGHLRYAGFTGTLPNITSVILDMVSWSFRVTGSFGRCLFSVGVTHSIVQKYKLNANHAVSGVELSGSITSSENCGPFGERVTDTLQGNSATNSAQTITLI